MMLASQSSSDIGRWWSSTHRIQVVQESGEVWQSRKKSLRDLRALLILPRLDCSLGRRCLNEEMGCVRRVAQRPL